MKCERYNTDIDWILMKSKFKKITDSRVNCMEKWGTLDVSDVNKKTSVREREKARKHIAK